MSVQGYESYRDSGVEWLGSVPTHWSVALSKRYFTVKSGDMISAADETVEGVPLIGGNGIRAYTAEANSPADTLVIGRVGALCGCVHHIQQPFWASEHAYRVVEKRALSKRFFYHLLGAINLNRFAIKTAQPLLNIDIVETQWISVPPLDEQASIAAFLDRETGKIDALVDAQTRLIELLKEKRQAVISHAVTKGLDPAAPMKDSGVEWLGQVPAHWVVCRLKDLAVPSDGVQMGPFGGMLKDLLDERDEFKVYGQENVTNCDFERGRRWIDKERFQQLSNYALLDGDLMLTRKGSVGNCVMFSSEAQSGIIDSDTIRIRLVAERIDTQFALTVLHDADYVAKQIDLTKRGAILAGLNTGVVSNLIVYLPPLAEQIEILKIVDTAKRRIDQLQAETKATIALLQERRAALISAAVTGKIDVRGWDASRQGVDQATARRLVGAAALELVADNPGSGRVKPMKLFYLAEVHAGVRELGGHYLRMAAGPYDDGLIREAESEMTRLGHIATTQPDGPGGQVLYQVTGQRGRYRNELNALLGERRGVFDKVLKDVGALDKKGAEAVATLYAVWNDMLLDGQAPDDDAVILGFLNDWHPEKKEKFKAAELRVWLAWMRRHDLTPRGQGQRTTTGRLFV